MDCIVVSSLLGIVDQLQLLLLHNKNPCLILPEIDDAQIILSTLKDKLRFLQAYLHKPKPIIASDPDRDKAVKRLDEEIRDFAIKAEYEIESKLANQQQGEAAACEDLHRSLQQVVKDIESVEVRIRDLQTRYTASIHDASSSSTPPCLQIENVRDGVSSSSKYDLENTMIGMEGDVEKIKGMLLIQTSSSTQLQVLSIVGGRGTGKTTLAKKVYGDPSIVSHFDIQAWTIGDQLLRTKRNVVIDILSCIVSLSKEEISKQDQDDEQLAEQLRKLLMGQRYFIVIEDLWFKRVWDDDLWMSEEEWDELITSFPDDRNGSRVLITTRTMKVAEFTSSSGMWIFETWGLNLEDSWKLLSKTATSNGKCSSLPPEFEKIGRCIVKKCRGIPLVIVLIGGLLATLNNSPSQWEDILFSIPVWGHPIEVVFACTIQVCYNYLPTHLKPCFLYFGVFPNNTEIHVKKLIKLWIAEGFANQEMNKSLEEIAKDYLCDLINRRLVQVHKRSLDRKIKSCMFHDFLQLFCMKKAIDEDIMTVSRMDDNEFIEGSRWVSRQYASPRSDFTNSSHKTRSLFYFDENLYLAKHWSIFSSSLKLLRVLDLSLIKCWHGMPSEIVNLVHLRYLALTTIGSVCNSLFKLQSLQTLILSTWTKEYQLQLPCNVLDLPWLRHVRFDKGSSSYLPNFVQENLQTLSWFKVTGRDTRTTNFTNVPNLKELGIYIEGEVLLNNALDNLAELRQLEKLKVKMGRAECFSLPNFFPPNLKQLTLSNTYLSWEDMDIIGKLPNLDLLKLKDFAFCGPEWKPRDGGFLQLRFFLIECSDLEHWNANANHFPALQHLILRYCWDLEKLPNDFEKVCTLRLIELGNCCSSLVTSTMEIQQRQQESGNEALVVRDVTKIELPTNKSSEKRSEYAI